MDGDNESFQAAPDEGGRQQENDDDDNNNHDEIMSDVGHASELHSRNLDNDTIGDAVMDHHHDSDSDDDISESEEEDDDDDDEDDDDDDGQVEWQKKTTKESMQALLLLPTTTTTSPKPRVGRQPPSQNNNKLHDFYLQSDDIAIEVGEVLAKNTTTTTNHTTNASFPLKLAFHIKKRLTEHGAQAIVQGLQTYYFSNSPQNDVAPPPQALLELTLEQVQLQTMSRAFRHMVLAILPILSIPTELTLMARCSNRDAYWIGVKLIEAKNAHLKKLQLIMDLSVTEMAAKRVCHGIAHTKLEQLVLCGYVSTDDQFQQSPRVMQLLFLQAIQTVRELVLEYPLRDDDATLLGHALGGNHHQQLSLLCIRLQHTLSIESAMTLAQGIQRSHIEHLNIRGGREEEDTISPEVGEVLYQGIQHLQTLRHLMIGTGMQATASLGNILTTARLSTLQVFAEEANCTPTILQALRNASQLSMLRFGPLLDSHDMRLLCEALPHLTSLTKLYIRGLLICDEGVALMAECSNNHEYVTYEDVKSRHVRAIGAEQLMMAIANHPCLEELDLDGSIDLAFVGLDMIGRLLPRVKLKRLYLNRLLDMFDDEDEDENVRRAHQKACQALLAGFRSNYHLEQYRVSSFLHLSVPQKKEIAYYLELNQSGRYLLGLEHQALATSVWCHVLARYKDNAGIFYGFLREQPTLVAAASFGYDPSAGSKRQRRES